MSSLISWDWIGPLVGFGTAFVPAACRKAKALWAKIKEWANEA
jgi:hypothetical protein